MQRSWKQWLAEDFMKSSLMVCRKLAISYWGIYPWENILDPTMAEARPCLKMVSFVKELGFRDVCVEGDALTVIRSLQFRFVPREANVTTHGLAMEGRQYGYPMYWVEEVPKEVERLVDKDRRGVGVIDHL
ncbi:hypothetical protein GOBAR_DD13118 [Gossypium barbadense]|nr:hypothetical protein GOBAR_DD13118 [Gossypium barbadense]